MGGSSHDFFDLPTGLSYFEHGGYSLPLKAVQHAQKQWQERINRNPSRFFRHEFMTELQGVRQILAKFLGTKSDNLCFLINATYALATLLKNFRWQAGDAILINSQAFYANRRVLQEYAEQHGLSLIEAPIALPVASSADLLASIQAAYHPAVKLALIDHIASPSGLIFPVKEISTFLRNQGVVTIVDGAQAPGQLPLQLDEMNCDFYIGNGHKWLTGARTSAFLFVRDAWMSALRGLVVSRGDDFPVDGRSRIQMETDWPGAYDPLPLLTLPTALEAMESIHADWESLYAANHRGLLLGLECVRAQVGVAMLGDPSLFASMATVRLSDAYRVDGKALHQALFAGGVTAQVFNRDEDMYMRFCHQAYIGEADYQKAAGILQNHRI